MTVGDVGGGPMSRPNPVTARRELAALLGRVRREAGHTQTSAGRALGWSLRKQQLLESGDQVISPADLDAVLTVLGVPVRDRGDWRTLVDAAHGRAWWDAFDDEDLPPEAKQLTGLEQGATRIRAFSALVIHGSLQTAEYRAAMVTGTAVLPRPAEQVAALMEVSRRRQRVLSGPDPLQLWAVMDEAALHRWVGPAAVMAEQLEHLVETASTRDNVTLQVIPFRAGPHAGLTGSFWLMEFGRPDDPGLVYVEAVPDKPTYLESRSQVYTYSRVFERLVSLALRVDESLQLLQDLARNPPGHE